MQNLVSQRDLTAYVEGRGYRAQRVFNDLQMKVDIGAELRVVALMLLGPRRSKTCIPLQYGCGDLDAAKLWCDFVDYGTTVTQERQAVRSIARRRAA